MTAARERWRRLPGAGRVVIGIVLILIVLNLGLALVDSATRGADESSPRSSSFSTGSTGVAGYAELLRRYGHPVARARGTVGADSLDLASTVVVLDAGFPSRREARAIARFVDAGGRLVAGGPDAAGWVAALPVGQPRWSTGGQRVTGAVVDGRRFTVQTDAGGQWEGAESRLVDTPAGARQVVLIADTSPLTNRLLGTRQNAAFGLALARAGRPVTFVEGPHGYGTATGLAAIPDRWKVTLVLGLLAALLALVAGARRIGPAERDRRELPPPRRAYVDALGVALARTHQPAQAILPLQVAARGLVAAREGLPPDAGAGAIRAAAHRAGWSAEEIEALFAPAGNDETIMRAGRALARAEKEAR